MNKKTRIKRVSVVLLMMSLTGGCIYNFPLDTEHRIAVDQSVIGLWEKTPDAGKRPDQNERMMIFKYSDTEYLVHWTFPENRKKELYFRAYPIEIGGISCVQIQLIGSSDGPLSPETTKALFHVVSYRLADGQLEVRTLNYKLVDDDLETPHELVEAFLEHKDNEDLFSDPVTYRRL